MVKLSGEYWNTQTDGDDYFHTMLTDDEADQLVVSWEVISKLKRCTYLRTSAEKTALNEWMEINDPVRAAFGDGAWERQYERRAQMFQYVHLYYFLKKAG